MEKAQTTNFNIPVPLPEALEKQYREIEKEYFLLLQSGYPQKAYAIWDAFYSEVLPKQPDGKRYHKGGPLHNMGIAKLFTNEPSEAFRLFILAYVEDILSETNKFAADNTPASNTLTGIFHFSKPDLQIVRHKVEALTRSGVVKDPQNAFNLYIQEPTAKTLSEKSKTINILIKQRYSISHIVGEWDKRVFVGGDYANRMPELFKLKSIIQNKGYEPILAIEFKIPTNLIHRHSLLLLHSCKYAIFDMATRSGQLMEAERTIDYENITLFICEDAMFPKISQMVTTYGVTIETYKNDVELTQKIGNFLP